jgi:hypothetical protein
LFIFILIHAYTHCTTPRHRSSQSPTTLAACPRRRGTTTETTRSLPTAPCLTQSVRSVVCLCAEESSCVCVCVNLCAALSNDSLSLSLSLSHTHAHLYRHGRSHCLCSPEKDVPVQQVRARRTKLGHSGAPGAQIHRQHPARVLQEQPEPEQQVPVRLCVYVCECV